MKQRKMTTGPGVPVREFSNNPSTSSATVKTADVTSVVDGSKISGQSARDIRELDIDLIDANKLAPREVYTREMIRLLADALADQGQHDPIHVVPNPDAPGRFIICDGWTRVQACREHGVLGGKLLAEIHHSLNLEESAWFGYQQNEGRNQHFDVDRGLFYSKLIAAGQSQTEIARRANLSKTLMSFYLSFGKLPDSVIDVIKDRPERFGATAAWHLSKYLDKSGLPATLYLAQQLVEEGHSVRWLAAQTRLPATDETAKPAAKIKTVKYVNGKYELADDQCKLEINLKNVPPATRSTFTIELERLIAMVAETDSTEKCVD